MNAISLDERTYHCKECGYTEDRDIKAAKTMIYLGQPKFAGVWHSRSQVPTERRDVKPVENVTSACQIRSDGKLRSTKQDAPEFIQG